MKFPTVKELKKRFWSHPRVVRFLNWTKRRSLPGFFKVPIYDVVTFLISETQRFAVVTRANSTAFSFFLAIFPSIIVLLTLLPYLSSYLLTHIPGGEDFMSIMYREIKFIMPGNAGDMLFETIEDLTTKPRTGMLSFGFLMALIFASNGMLAMMRSFEKSYKKTFRKRTAFNKRLVSIGLTFLLGLLLIASVVLVIVGNLLIDLLSQYIHLDWFSTLALSMLRYIVIIALFYSVIAVIYRFGVATRKRMNFFTPGATMATLLCLLSSQVFSFYVDNFNTYNKLYGSIGTVIVVMLWIQINSLFLLLGFELNAGIAVNRDLERKDEDDDDA